MLTISVLKHCPYTKHFFRVSLKTLCLKISSRILVASFYFFNLSIFLPSSVNEYTWILFHFFLLNLNTCLHQYSNWFALAQKHI